MGARVRTISCFQIRYFQPGAQKSSATGTRTRVARVRAEYPNQLDYSGTCKYNVLVWIWAGRMRNKSGAFEKRPGCPQVIQWCWDPGSWMLDTLRWILHPRSRILNPGSQALGFACAESWVLGAGSWLLAPGSWLVPGTWILHQSWILAK